MKVEIWSDVMCPFCYIGKRKFELALEKFPQRDTVEITWKSFQLNPDMITDPDKNINQYLAEVKGWSVKQAEDANNYVTDIAKKVGLTYNMDKSIVANSFDAHRLSHLAKKYNKQDALEERLFLAYFTEGKNTADHDTLIAIGVEIGLEENEIKSMLESNEFSAQVNRDILEAQMVGARGVPFFVFDRKYAVSGAQDPAAFEQVLNTIWEEQTKLTPITLNENAGDVCGPDGCD
ncbi:MAG: DsbA family oxidoreductase [Chitinophagales bacterium]|nr:DsbA family oxidoreductase [Bacteroidota bacterium]MBK7568510.1 DsbA family oxidoreductase [Bacteroidota bacterium]MBP8916462.1 DsbA family oxidoreductase [Chitinophagales bacterium]MBP9220548.1 DsbA family oxidoreductase [Chitinophagales bacterium]MBP9795859.1 DsbA family oxidoreductase [Chitinophagales bacterium]